MIQSLETPLSNRFFDLVNHSSDRIVLCSPFIKQSIINQILKAKKDETDLEVMTASNPTNFECGSTDASAIETLVNAGYIVRNYFNLHAKIYLFDNKEALVTSSNLTVGGFQRNFEYGLLVSDAAVVNKIKGDYYALAHDHNCGLYDRNNIKDLLKLSEALQRTNKWSKPVGDEEATSLPNSKDIVKGLNPWQSNLFQCLVKIPKNKFNLAKVYAISEKFMQQKYPENHTIKDSIRRNLEELRNLGLIQFVDNDGTYKKLWDTDTGEFKLIKK